MTIRPSTLHPNAQWQPLCHQRSWRPRPWRSGQAIVEFALIVPMLLALVLGIIEFGWLNKNNLTIANAAREGIRYAALGHSATDTKTRILNAASILNVPLTEPQIVLESTSDTTTASPAYYGWPADTTSPARNGVPVGNLIRITVSYPHRQLTGFFPFLNKRVIRVQVSMAREATSAS